MEIFVPKHEMHAILKKAGIPQAKAAHYCKTGVSNLSQILNGYRPCPTWIEAKLALLRDEIERQQVKETANGK